MDTTHAITEVAELLGRLSADDVQQRLAELDAEERALRTLLRSIRARERVRERRQGAAGGAR